MSSFRGTVAFDFNCPNRSVGDFDYKIKLQTGRGSKIGHACAFGCRQSWPLNFYSLAAGGQSLRHYGGKLSRDHLNALGIGVDTVGLV